MCGIAGFIAGRSQGTARPIADIAASMSETLRHRGPDDDGVWIDQDAGVALVHRRLSIVDLSPTGHQPMISADGRYVIIYNGEVYSHEEIRPSLAARGISFRGHSDTEVILESFAAFGVEATPVGAGTETLVCPPNVRALGIRRDVERVYAAADLVVSSSAFGEGFSNVLAEGMSAGLVPVATDVGDAGRIVGPIGHVVAPRSPTALAAAIKAEATLALDQRRDRGRQARARIVGSFARARAIDAYAHLYQEIIGTA